MSFFSRYLHRCCAVAGLETEYEERMYVQYVDLLLFMRGPLQRDGLYAIWMVAGLLCGREEDLEVIATLTSDWRGTWWAHPPFSTRAPLTLVRVAAHAWMFYIFTRPYTPPLGGTIAE